MTFLEEREAPISTRPALFEVSAVASVAGFRDTCGNVPLDGCVPTITGAPLLAALPTTAMRVLCHVDGTASLGAIAESASLSLPDAIEGFLILLRVGAISVQNDAPLAPASAAA